ncbi:hypothetical protein NDU88_005743 [Pleurodeles waltl]|uniref:Uncharacterized protein n=1 Tax=Pleurodeles waltl TaxID=8319 RepID=A0AAV7LNM5_PLEWA|nr:hypothetical protein NDU88_005743 [Pleurodeles waltl]
MVGREGQRSPRAPSVTAVDLDNSGPGCGPLILTTWRPGRSLDPSAPFPATSGYPGRRPPSGLTGTAGTAARLGETGAFSSRCERAPDPAGRVWDSSARAERGERRGELRLRSRSRFHRARPLPASPPA